MPSDVFDANGRLSEAYVQEMFHSYLKSSLAQAKAEHLVDVQMLSSAEGDLMITGPALCLYFAALRCTTNPPSVPLPRRDKQTPQNDLSSDNCPPAFLPFLQLWAQCVPDIQRLAPEHQHDLARIVCNLEPIASPINPSIFRVAHDLRAVAIEISLRRTFQDRYAQDLQAAIDTGGESGSHRVSFVPPPEYSPSANNATFGDKELPPPPAPARPRPPSIEVNGRPLSGPPTASLLTPTAPAIELIRETLYAALADVLETTPRMRQLLRTDPTRSYFGAVALAILSVASTAMTPDGGVRGVMGTNLHLSDCPSALRPLMLEFAGIGHAATEMEEQDTEEAMRLVAVGEDIPPPRLERVKTMLEHGVAFERQGAGRDSPEGRAVAFANRINALAIRMTELPQFRQRQNEVFDVLKGVAY
ncbi:hypothetical protein PENSPDRAFT_667891 [Peniophora sp. CONT]|nr:hypothetical protein PENSPDRAFT_667891 [Peniophora sp. CONT]